MKHLVKFKLAQDNIGWANILEQLESGKKTTHWMWFVFPQLFGLGKSPKAQFFGLRDLTEAVQYLEDPILKERLEDGVWALMKFFKRPISNILGEVDAEKFQSTLTLFKAVAYEINPELDDLENPFHLALSAFYEGKQCEVTLNLLPTAAITASTTDDTTTESIG